MSKMILFAKIHASLKATLFSTHPHCCLTLPWIELQMLLRCYLIHKRIIILRHFLLYLCLSLDLGLFMSYLCDLFFLFIMINRIISLIQTHLFFCLFFQNMSYYFWMITWMKNVNNFQIGKVQPQDVAWPLVYFLPISVW